MVLAFVFLFIVTLTSEVMTTPSIREELLENVVDLMHRLIERRNELANNTMQAIQREIYFILNFIPPKGLPGTTNSTESANDTETPEMAITTISNSDTDIESVI